MRLTTLQLSGLATAFPREVSVDFAALGPGLHAIVGDNGAGKTTFLESVYAALYRQFPSYGESFCDHVTPGERNAFAELTFTLDRPYRVRVQSDPAASGGRGKTEAYLSRDDGAGFVPLAGPGLGDVDRSLAIILPSAETFLASAFACQGGGGSFWSLKKAARKDLFVGMLGIARLQTFAERGALRAKTVLETLERVRADRQTVAGRLTRMQELVTALATATAATAEADAAMTAARAARDTAAVAARDATAVRDRVRHAQEAQAAERARLTTAQTTAEAEIVTLTTERDTLAATLKEAAAIRAAAAALPALEQRLSAARAAEQSAAATVTDLATRVTTLTADRERLLAQATPLQAQVAEAEAATARVETSTLLADRAAQQQILDATTQALATLEAATAALETAATDERNATAVRTRMEERQTALAGRVTLLAAIPNVPACGTCPLTEDARQAQEESARLATELAALPIIDGTPAADALAAHQAECRTVETRRDAAQRWVTDHADALAALAVDRETAGRLAALRRELDAIIAQGTQVRVDKDAAAEALTDAQSAATTATATRGALETERATVAGTAGQLPTLVQAETAHTHAVAQLAKATATRDDAARALAGLPSLDVDGPTAAAATADATLATADQALASATTTHATCRETAAGLEGERAALGDPQAEDARLAAREQALATEAADWTLLTKALGRDGVQALEIDAAGPTVAALANDLLRTCYGPRFQLALETTGWTKDRKKQTEVFDIRILDAEAGREAKRGSGGEMVLLDEALRLALALFNTGRSGFRLETLWRDETVGALSPANAQRYLDMLRRAMVVGQFHQCFVVAHQPDVWRQADHRLVVQDGQVQLDGEIRRAA